MTTQTEALKLALEFADDVFRGNYKGNADEVITAIKETLAQPEQICGLDVVLDESMPPNTFKLAQPEQQVDWEKLYRLEVKKKEALAAKYERDIKPLTRIVPMAQPEQEPVAWLVYAKGSRRYFTLTFDVEKVPEIYKGGEAVPLYTTPPQRKPMTDENCTWKQHDDIHMPDTWEADCGAMWTFTEGGPKDNDMHYCPKCGKPAIEAAHGIKE